MVQFSIRLIGAMYNSVARRGVDPRRRAALRIELNRRAELNRRIEINRRH